VASTKYECTVHVDVPTEYKVLTTRQAACLAVQAMVEARVDGDRSEVAVHLHHTGGREGGGSKVPGSCGWVTGGQVAREGRNARHLALVGVAAGGPRIRCGRGNGVCRRVSPGSGEVPLESASGECRPLVWLSPDWLAQSSAEGLAACRLYGTGPNLAVRIVANPGPI
jgi:hypothetical protein